MTASFLSPPPPQPLFTFVHLGISARHLYFSLFLKLLPCSFTVTDYFYIDLSFFFSFLSKMQSGV